MSLLPPFDPAHRAIQETGMLSILWRGKWLMLVSVGLAVGLSIVLTLRATKVYEAIAMLQVSSSTTGSTAGANALDVQLANQSLAATYATMISDESFLEQIRRDVAGGALSTSELRELLTASAIENTSLVQLKVQGASPAAARTLATEIAESFVRFVEDSARTRSKALQRQVEALISTLSSEIERLQQTAAGVDPTTSERLESLRSARAALTEQLARIVASGIEESGSVALTAPPSASIDPVKPKLALNLLAGILVGLGIGFLLSWLLVRLDRKLHSAAEAEAGLGVPLLASVPLRRRSVSHDDHALREAFDVLRANLAFVSVERPLQVLTFTSYSQSEGKTTTVEGLGRAFARAGSDVLLIDGDVRTETLSRRCTSSGASGLTDVLVGRCSPMAVIRRLECGASLLPAGAVPPNPPSLLASTRMRELLAEFRAQREIILIDAPPVAHLADASILSSLSDGVVLVARVGTTSRDDLARAATILRHGPTPIVGVVVIEPRPKGHSYSYYRSQEPGVPELEPQVPHVRVLS